MVPVTVMCQTALTSECQTALSEAGTALLANCTAHYGTTDIQSFIENLYTGLCKNSTCYNAAASFGSSVKSSCSQETLNQQGLTPFLTDQTQSQRDNAPECYSENGINCFVKMAAMAYANDTANFCDNCTKNFIKKLGTGKLVTGNTTQLREDVFKSCGKDFVLGSGSSVESTPAVPSASSTANVKNFAVSTKFGKKINSFLEISISILLAIYV
ncbi:hypothetical protein HK098_001157 [Nowakowskiella sp. JEL0407]|nr:hypothetical protein HK098_001157 [Nowakowskiella sp. JEL0407]